MRLIIIVPFATGLVTAAVVDDLLQSWVVCRWTIIDPFRSGKIEWREYLFSLPMLFRRTIVDTLLMSMRVFRTKKLSAYFSPIRVMKECASWRPIKLCELLGHYSIGTLARSFQLYSLNLSKKRETQPISLFRIILSDTLLVSRSEWRSRHFVPRNIPEVRMTREQSKLHTPSL